MFLNVLAIEFFKKSSRFTKILIGKFWSCSIKPKLIAGFLADGYLETSWTFTKGIFDDNS